MGQAKRRGTRKIAVERQLTDYSLTDSVSHSNDRSGREPGIDYPAGYKVDRPVGMHLSADSIQPTGCRRPKIAAGRNGSDRAGQGLMLFGETVRRSAVGVYEHVCLI